MLHCDFDGGLDLAGMMTIDCALDGLYGEVRSNYISWLKTEKPETWNAYVEQKKKMGVIVDE